MCGNSLDRCFRRADNHEPPVVQASDLHGAAISIVASLLCSSTTCTQIWLNQADHRLLTLWCIPFEDDAIECPLLRTRMLHTRQIGTLWEVGQTIPLLQHEVSVMRKEARDRAKLLKSVCVDAVLTLGVLSCCMLPSDCDMWNVCARHNCVRAVSPLPRPPAHTPARPFVRSSVCHNAHSFVGPHARPSDRPTARPSVRPTVSPSECTSVRQFAVAQCSVVQCCVV